MWQQLEPRGDSNWRHRHARLQNGDIDCGDDGDDGDDDATTFLALKPGITHRRRHRYLWRPQRQRAAERSLEHFFIAVFDHAVAERGTRRRFWLSLMPEAAAVTPPRVRASQKRA